jgi:hypothetical protein
MRNFVWMACYVPMNSYELAVLKRYPFPLIAHLSLLKVNLCHVSTKFDDWQYHKHKGELLQRKYPGCLQGNVKVILGCPWGNIMEAIDTMICM